MDDNTYKITLISKVFKVMLSKEWNKIVKLVNDILDILKKKFQPLFWKVKIWFFTSKDKIFYLIFESLQTKQEKNLKRVYGIK